MIISRSYSQISFNFISKNSGKKTCAQLLTCTNLWVWLSTFSWEQVKNQVESCSCKERFFLSQLLETFIVLQCPLASDLQYFSAHCGQSGTRWGLSDQWRCVHSIISQLQIPHFHKQIPMDNSSNTSFPAVKHFFQLWFFRPPWSAFWFWRWRKWQWIRHW